MDEKSVSEILNVVYNEDCLLTMGKLPKVVDIVLTSPPYNTSRPGSSDKYNNRYDEYCDSKTDEEYIEWLTKIFNGYDTVLKPNGCVLFNISYSSENTSLIWLLIADVIRKTNFITADCIIWKKKHAIPNNRSKNKLTRICEHVFIFCRKSEIKSFNCNKKVVSVIEKTGQDNYENIYNLIEAANNDGCTDLNKATFSVDLVSKLLNIYGESGSVVYDSFMGIGTTAEACILNGMKFIGSELSKKQCDFANDRIDRIKRQTQQQKLF